MAQKLLFAISNRKFKLRFWKHTDTCQCNAASAEGRGGGAAAAEDMDLDAEQTGMDLGNDSPVEAGGAAAAEVAADTATARSAAADILNLGADDEAAAAEKDAENVAMDGFGDAESEKLREACAEPEREADGAAEKEMVDVHEETGAARPAVGQRDAPHGQGSGSSAPSGQ
jgi:hypothetical protein